MCVHVYTIYIHADIYMFCTCVFECTCIYIGICACTNIYTYMCICILIYINMCIYAFMYTYMYTYKFKLLQTDLSPFGLSIFLFWKLTVASSSEREVKGYRSVCGPDSISACYSCVPFSLLV